jgi:hypothetical protein
MEPENLFYHKKKIEFNVDKIIVFAWKGILILQNDFDEILDKSMRKKLKQLKFLSFRFYKKMKLIVSLVLFTTLSFPKPIR